MLPASTGHVRCSSCGSPTSIAATEARQTTVIIETAARVLAERLLTAKKEANRLGAVRPPGQRVASAGRNSRPIRTRRISRDADRCRPVPAYPAGCDAWCSRRFYSYFLCIYCCASCSRRASGARPGRRSARPTHHPPARPARDSAHHPPDVRDVRAAGQVEGCARGVGGDASAVQVHAVDGRRAARPD